MTTGEPTRVRPAGPRRARRRWSGDGVLALVVGVLLVVTGVGLLGSGAPALWVDQQSRDADGFVTTDERRLTTPTAALVVAPLEVALDRPGDGLLLRRALGDVRVHVSSPTGAALFVGLGPAAEVEEYLADVPVDRLRDLVAGTPVRLERRDGDSRPRPPAEQDLWVESAQGTGRLDLDWTVREGRWALVVLHPDGGRGVQADVSVGATLPALTWVSATMVVLGALFLGGGLVLLGALARPGRGQPTGTATGSGPRRLVPSPRTGPDAPLRAPAGPRAGT